MMQLQQKIGRLFSITSGKMDDPQATNCWRHVSYGHRSRPTGPWDDHDQDRSRSVHKITYHDSFITLALMKFRSISFKATVNRVIC